jgi:hypothetical protein
MTDRTPGVYTPEEVAAKIAETGMEGWYSLAGPELPTIAQGDRGGTPF